MVHLADQNYVRSKEAGHAEHHYSAISHNPYRFMYDQNIVERQTKLIISAGNPASYKIYSIFIVNDFERHNTNRFWQKDKILIDTRPSWKPARSQNIRFAIYITFGEVYARLKLKSQEARVKLEEIENVRSVSTIQVKGLFD